MIFFSQKVQFNCISERMTIMGKTVPLGEKILSTLIELYADQMGVKVEYTIGNKPEAGLTLISRGPAVQEVARCG